MTSATWRRIFISVDMELKNQTRIGEIDMGLRRDTDNFNKRYVRPVNAVVINSQFIPTGAEILIHHNATHATYEIFDYAGLDGNYIAGNIRYFSIPESEAYAWRLGHRSWNPCPGYELGLRIFKPYDGALAGILPTQIKNKLFITSGEYGGKVVLTKPHSDYEIIYQDKGGRENYLIRLRHYSEPENIREEIVGIDYEATEKIESGEYLIGINPQTANKKLWQEL